jgi:hypothetical protein
MVMSREKRGLDLPRSDDRPIESAVLGFDADRRRQVTTLAAILGSIVVNTVANRFPPNGLNIGSLSNALFSAIKIQPANYAFAIWGLIYIGLIAFGIYQLQPAQRHNPRLQRCGYLLPLACLAQCLWIYLFLFRLFPLSTVAMLGILLPLMVMYQRLGQQPGSRRDRWLIDLPIGIYLGWISVATIINVAIALYSLNWNGWGLDPSVWAAIMMMISATIATIVLIQRRDRAYAWVIVWALVAITIRQVDTPLIAGTGRMLALALMVLSLVVKPHSYSRDAISRHG